MTWVLARVRCSGYPPADCVAAPVNLPNSATTEPGATGWASAKLAPLTAAASDAGSMTQVCIDSGSVALLNVTVEGLYSSGENGEATAGRLPVVAGPPNAVW